MDLPASHFTCDVRRLFPRSCHVVCLALSLILLSTVGLSAAVDSSVVFNEVHYHPVAAGDGEWLELHCLSGVNVDISGWRITGGVDYQFPEGTVIPGHGYLVVAGTLGSSSLSGVTALGPFSGQLSNSGEELQLVNRSGRIMDTLEYENGGDWPVAADGGGVTLAKRDGSSADDSAANWTWSAQTGGSPGLANFATSGQQPTTTTLASLDSSWKYRDTNTAPPGDWNTSNFDDSTWATGASAFYAGSPQLAGGAEGLAGYWPIQENSGTSTQNLVNGGPAGQLNGGAGFVNDPSRAGQVLQFNGSGAYVDAGSTTIPQMTATNDFTWAFWANSAESASDNVMLGNRYSPAGGEWSPSEFIKFTTNKFEFRHDGSSADDIDYADLAVNTWIHHAVVKSGTSLTYYRNGTAVNSHVFTQGLNNAQPLYFGGDKTNESWSGKLDDIAIWNKALSALQVSALAAGTTTPLNASTPATLQTPLQNGSTTYYFRRTFNFSGSPARTSLALQLLVDDGAVVYLNGQKIHSQNMPDGPITHSTPATSAVVAAELSAAVTLPGTALVKGTNVIAVEVHQYLPTADPGMVFGLQLNATEQPTQPPDASPGVVFNEISAAGSGFKLELFNDGTAPVSLGGYAVKSSTGSSYAIPAQTLNPGGYLVITAATLGFTPANNDYLFLFKPGDSELADARKVTKKLRGRSAQGRWLFPSAASFGSANTFSFNTAIVINEIMYHPRPVSQSPFTESDEQWIELHNRSDAGVTLTGWALTGGISFSFPSGTTIPAGGYLVVAKNADALKAKWPAVANSIIGVFSGNISGKGEFIGLEDTLGNPVNGVDFSDGGRWPKEADGGCSSLELRDPRADNTAPEAWAASREDSLGSWQTFTWQEKADNFNGDPTQWNEFIFGLLEAGTFLIDDISVIEDPDGTARQLIQNGDFESGATTNWRLLGNHRKGTVISDPYGSGKVLRVVADGSTEHMHNHAETTLAASGVPVTINSNLTYRISFRARWMAGSNQLNARLYFNRLAQTVTLPVAAGGGTPGAANSTAEANHGPTYSGLTHSPAVPPAGQTATVSVAIADPDNVTSATLFYSVNDSGFNSTPMTLADGLYSGVIPSQTAGSKVQFYVQAVDSLGTSTCFPAAGADSRALIPWEDGQARLAMNGVAPNNLRIVMTGPDTTFLHTPTNVMSNERLGCTVILNESTIFYDCSVTLKGSERGRNQDTRVSFRVAFPADNKLYGAHKSVAIDRSGAGNETSQKEILIKHAITHAGDIPGSEDDLCRVIAPLSKHTGPAILVKERYDNIYLDNQYDDGAEGRMFKYELIYYPLTTTGGVQGLKYPEPDNYAGVGVGSLGANKELYRWHWLAENNEDADDYDGIMALLAAMGRTADAQYFTDTTALMDVDQWLRAWAIQVLFGIGDSYGGGSGQHNAIFYQRPLDGRWLLFPHDMDFTFSNGATSSITPNGDLVKLLGNSAHKRAYYGHLYDLCSSTFNTAYLGPWAQHYSAFLNENLSAHMGYISQRNAHALAQINTAIPPAAFAITTTDGTSFPGSFATIQGTGWLDLRELRLEGQATPLSITWINDSTWQVSLPISQGSNTFTLNGYNSQGLLIGARTVTVLGTGPLVSAAAGNLVISEFMYHPTPCTPAETAEGYSDPEDFEFVELKNTSTSTLDLSNVRFTAGIDYLFAIGTQLSPGACVLVARNRDALTFRYGPGLPLASGQYGTASKLSNDGEEIVLADAAGRDIVRFTYDDAAPWPQDADGPGYSLNLVNPASNPDPSLVRNWRLSSTLNGSPGVSDATRFSGDPDGDDNHDGIKNLVQYTFAGTARYSSPTLSLSGGQVTLQFQRNLAADDVLVVIDTSEDLIHWELSSSSLEMAEQLANGDGTATIIIRGPIPAGTRQFYRLGITLLP